MERHATQEYFSKESTQGEGGGLLVEESIREDPMEFYKKSSDQTFLLGGEEKTSPANKLEPARKKTQKTSQRAQLYRLQRGDIISVQK